MKLEWQYHAGELLVQARVGVLSEGEKNSQVIQDSIMIGLTIFSKDASQGFYGDH